MGLVLEQRGDDGFSEPISRMDIGSSHNGDFSYLLNREKVDARLATPTPEVDEGLASIPSKLQPGTQLDSKDSKELQTYVRNIICSFPWPQGCEYWIAVAWCESSLRPSAIGYIGTYVGLFQVWTGHGYGFNWLLDLYNNTLAAWELSNGGTYTGAWPVCQ